MDNLIERRPPISSTKEFSEFFEKFAKDVIELNDVKYLDFYEQLSRRNNDCLKMLDQIESSTKEFQNLQNEYEFVSNKTSSLHAQSENIIEEQNKLRDIADKIHKQLYYFTQYEKIAQRLASPTLSISSDAFVSILDSIDECLKFMGEHPTYKEAAIYRSKYKQCLNKAGALIKSYVIQVLTQATDQIVSVSAPEAGGGEISSDAIFALYYGKFQGSGPKIKKISAIVEGRRLQENPEYEQLHSDMINLYFSYRANVMRSAVEQALTNLTSSYNRDHCALIRTSSSFLVHVCQDEHRLYYQFFAVLNSQLTSYLEGLCVILYDLLRPFIIHINHLETLAEICSILKEEMLEEHVNNSPDSLEAFSKVVYQLLNDVQERLVFRTHIYLQKDIAYYKPSPGDLAYPEQLEMMESIAKSLRHPPGALHRTDSRVSTTSSVESEAAAIVPMPVDLDFKGNSPADLHGMWYPTVRRTLVCLSRLYRCVDRSIFQGLSQEAISYCIQSISSAAQLIAAKKSLIDGELFEIKHLLILREQIAPFAVDFTVKETSLDFSKVKTAAFSLLLKRKQLFTLGSTNALLEFLLEGTPQVKEHLLDSKKDVDRQLKNVCEIFIKDACRGLITPVFAFLDKTRLPQPVQTPGATRPQWASPQAIGGIIQESKRLIKKKLPTLQRSMQLYLANKDTEFILLRPIRVSETLHEYFETVFCNPIFNSCIFSRL